LEILNSYLESKVPNEGGEVKIKKINAAQNRGQIFYIILLLARRVRGLSILLGQLYIGCPK